MIKPRMRTQIILFETWEFWLWRSLVRSMKWKTTSKQFWPDCWHTLYEYCEFFLLFPAHVRCKNSTLRTNWLRRALSWSNVWYLIVKLKSVDAFIRYVDDECDRTVYILYFFIFYFHFYIHLLLLWLTYASLSSELSSVNHGFYLY